ncbi:acetyl-CoA carboxylase biotin carboxylase subunit [bacterium]|nr:acetyl-CoA carboxylase biotin carboxylase subunit [bacterium]
MAKKLKKVLIANRGEIAVRIIRACQEMDILPVAVYSDVDKKALHVQLADEAYYLGGAKPSESYLNIDKLIHIAQKCKADALHPGYGFLAENSKLVQRCEEKGIIFIGPPSEAMKTMGIKTTSRSQMAQAGVPIIPGTVKPIKTEKELKREVQKIGFPLILKAAAGGGGKGLRLVFKEEDLLSSFRLAKSEAQSSFDDSSVYIEKYIQEPHHIEVQVLCDQHGQAIHLGERECSIQRRYQKVLEETPSPFLNEEIRQKMGRVAVKAAQAVHYHNAGTVEFVVDGKKNFYFLEMNTRLQVEHPITEMITGVDLVKAQLEVASGLPLRLAQKDIFRRGHSMQCRIYAEDPENNFMPSPGKIEHFRSPGGGLGVRDDSGIYEGFRVPLEYDPLLSKLITWGNTRKEAIHRMLRALSEYQIYGIKTTIPFFKRILLHPQFYAGKYNTHFIANLEKGKQREEPEEQFIALVAAGVKSHSESKRGLVARKRKKSSNWKFQGKIQNFSNNF